MGTFRDYGSRWDTSTKHLPRADNYKGDQDVVVFPGLKYDTCSSLGLLYIIGLFVQVRGLALDTQKRCVALLRKVMALISFEDGVDTSVSHAGGGRRLCCLEEAVSQI